jgi:hypothetical protein
MKPTYFWKNNQVVEVNARIPAALLDGSTMWKFLYCPCVDAKNDTPQFRSGMFVNEGGGMVARTTWHYIPYDQLPAEFRAHLLLMGV